MKQPSKCKVFKAIQVNTPLRASTDFLHLQVQMIRTILEFCYVPERKISTITTLEHWDTATNTYGHELGTLRVEETGNLEQSIIAFQQCKMRRRGSEASIFIRLQLFLESIPGNLG